VSSNAHECKPLLAGLSSLILLDLSGNELTSLPAALGGLAALKMLDLDKNQLTSLPEELGG